MLTSRCRFRQIDGLLSGRIDDRDGSALPGSDARCKDTCLLAMLLLLLVMLLRMVRAVMLAILLLLLQLLLVGLLRILRRICPIVHVAKLIGIGAGHVCARLLQHWALQPLWMPALQSMCIIFSCRCIRHLTSAGMLTI